LNAARAEKSKGHHEGHERYEGHEKE